MVSILDSLSFAVLMASLLVACGGDIVVVEGASGGGGAAATSASSTTPGSTGDSGSSGDSGGTGGAGGGCDGLQSDFLAKLDAAQGCNPDINVAQCTGAVTALDLCGCPVVANDTSSAAAQTAVTAFDAWAAAGCGPAQCITCPPPPTSPWYCDATDSICKPIYIK